MDTEGNHPILDKIRANGALERCHQCGGSEFRYVGHSTGASVILEPSSLDPNELLPNTRSYKLHIVGCKKCHYLLTFFDKE